MNQTMTAVKDQIISLKKQGTQVARLIVFETKERRKVVNVVEFHIVEREGYLPPLTKAGKLSAFLRNALIETLTDAADFRIDPV